MVNAYSAARAAIESLYTGNCKIIEYQSYKKENKSTGHHEVPVLHDQPCKLSFSKITSTSQSATAALVGQSAKVLISPEITIQPGSKLIITQNGITTEYKNSGEAAVYTTHQEVILELFKGWA